MARAGDRFAVTVEERTFHVDAAAVDAHLLSLIVDPPPAAPAAAAGASAHEVVLAADDASGLLTVSIAGVPIAVSVDAARRWSRAPDAAAGGRGPQRVTAPMPGKVVRILVSHGDRVHARQPLVVVEAMKMENELRAAREGTVADVRVREGQSVDAGALLVVVQS